MRLNLPVMAVGALYAFAKAIGQHDAAWLLVGLMCAASAFVAAESRA